MVPHTTTTSEPFFQLLGGSSSLSTMNDEEGPSSRSLTRCQYLWFSDGSVVLRAENTLFRVHMTQLSRRSPFFQDLFSLPQPPSNMDSGPEDCELEREEGCPVVVLYDSADDWTNLLMAIYDGPHFGENDGEDFKVAAGILRLSSKYVMDKLRAQALAHLCTAWPPSLKGWDLREDLARAYETEHTLQRGHRYPSPVAVIKLAREVHAPELLPSAFYDLSRYHFTQIFEPDKGDPLGAEPLPSSLAPGDLQRLALGKEASQIFVSTLIQSMAIGSYRDQSKSKGASTMYHHRRRSSGQVCMTAAACQKDLAELVELATQHYLFDRERGCTDPLYVAEELGQLKSAEFSECKACSRVLESWAAKERERMWKLIPVWFKLDP